MRKLFTVIAAMLLSVATFAQAPQGFSYQAVVRDAQNAIVANQTVEVTVTILQGATFESAKAVFTEKHSAKTNANGLFTLTIGSVDAAGFAKIDWGKGSCFLKTESAYGESTTQLMSVPYALYAANAGTIDNTTIEQFVSNIDFTTYNLVNKSTLANYTTAQKLKDTLAVYAKTADLPEGVNLTGYAKTDDLAKVATTGSYNDLTNKPTIPTTVSQLTDAGNYLTTSTAASTYATQSSLVTVATALNDLAERPTIPMINVTVKIDNYSKKAANTTIKLFNIEFKSDETPSIETVYNLPAYSLVFLNIKRADNDDYYSIKVNNEEYRSSQLTYSQGYLYNGFGENESGNSLSDRMFLIFKNQKTEKYEEKWIFALPGEDCTIEIFTWRGTN